MKCKDLSGMKFGRLTVLLYDGKKSNSGRRKWLCECECGKRLYVTGSDLGKTKSCGCLKIANNKSRSKHNMKGTRIYNEWVGIKARCNNPKATHYKNYGGRGIKVCKEWESDFLTFYKWAIENGYSDDLTLDRIDTNKDYEPDNCRWVSMKIQNRNKRSNCYLTFNGKTQIIADWAYELGISPKVIQARMERGWSIEEILTMPILKSGQNRNRRTSHFVTYKGQKMLLTELSRLTHVAPQTIKKYEESYNFDYDRIIQDVLNTPNHKYGLAKKGRK